MKKYSFRFNSNNGIEIIGVFSTQGGHVEYPNDPNIISCFDNPGASGLSGKAGAKRILSVRNNVYCVNYPAACYLDALKDVMILENQKLI